MTKSAKKSPQKPSPPPEARRGRPLGLLALLGGAAALWALFLWTELLRSRGGGTPFCAFGQDGDCGKLWDAAFASTIHGLTGLPVAAWGLVWGLVALTLPLLALVALADGKDGGRALTAIRWTAVAGVLGVFVMLAASASEGLFCSSCALTYLVSLAYGVAAFTALPPRRPLLAAAGVGPALATVAVFYVLLLYPGLQTPKSVAREEQRALAQAGEQAAAAAGAQESQPTTGSTVEAGPQQEKLLEEYLASVQPQVAQLLSDSLLIYRQSPMFQEPPRSLRGSPAAPVRIVDFTDALCGHCATLHGTLGYLESVLPPGSFSVDSRQFPLDGNCNAELPTRGPESVRCLASRAQICMERTPHAFEFAGAVFERQGELTEDLVYELAAPYMERSPLADCVANRETNRLLAGDVAYAWKFEPDGTPLVLVNGRQGSAFGPFLYAIILAGGNADHPLFASLPEPREGQHIH